MTKRRRKKKFYNIDHQDSEAVLEAGDDKNKAKQPVWKKPQKKKSGKKSGGGGGGAGKAKSKSKAKSAAKPGAATGEEAQNVSLGQGRGATGARESLLKRKAQ